jgi:hypothetical protein
LGVLMRADCRFNGVWSERHIEGIQTFTVCAGFMRCKYGLTRVKTQVMCKPTGNFGDVSGISSDVATCKIYE